MKEKREEVKKEERRKKRKKRKVAQLNHPIPLVSIGFDPIVSIF